MEYEWVFQRGRQKLIVQRWRRPDKVWELTLIWPSGEAETEGYLDAETLVGEHVRLERELTTAGWVMVEFRPERRKAERRRTARPFAPSSDRRKLGRVVPLAKPKSPRRGPS